MPNIIICKFYFHLTLKFKRDTSCDIKGSVLVEYLNLFHFDKKQFNSILKLA